MQQKEHSPDKYIKFIVYFLIAILVIIAGFMIEGKLNHYNVPDPVLVERLDIIQNGVINRYDDVGIIVKVSLPNTGLKDITGLEYCGILDTLYIQDNEVSDLSPVEGLELEKVNIANNPIDDIGVLLEMDTIKELTLTSGNIPEEQLDKLKSMGIPKIVLDGELITQ